MKKPPEPLELVVSGNALRKVRDRYLMTQSAFAQLVGVSREWVILAEKSEPRHVRAGTLEKLGAAMGVSAREARDVLQRIDSSFKLGLDGERVDIPGPVIRDAPVTTEKLSKVKLRAVPYFHARISASGWTESVDPRSAGEADGWVSVPTDIATDAFALRIDGDCMEPKFPSGSVIVFVPVRPGSATFEAGKDYYVEHSDGGGTFKRVYYEPARKRYRLETLNKKYKAFHVPEQMVAKLSVAVRLIQEL